MTRICRSSPSYVERPNLSLRLGKRRFTRLTNYFSKKAENHTHAVSLLFRHDNFCTPHTTFAKAAGGTETTPAMAGGVNEDVWKVGEILEKMSPTYLLQ